MEMTKVKNVDYSNSNGISNEGIFIKKDESNGKDVELKLHPVRVVFMALIVALAYIVWGAFFSFLPSFYPIVARAKGSTSEQYGFVFGCNHLLAVLTGPVVARFGHHIPPKILYTAGSFIQAFVYLIFGFLDKINNLNLFLFLSYTLRGVLGIADVMAISGVTTVLIKLYPDYATRILAYTDLTYFLGYFISPSVGMYLYLQFGFLLPFLIAGIIGLVASFGIVLLFPNVHALQTENATGLKPNFQNLKKTPSIFLPFLDNFVMNCGNSFLYTLAQEHLESYDVSDQNIGYTLTFFGLCFAGGCIVFGILCDKMNYPTVISLLGNLEIAILFTFVGPLPFVPFVPSPTAVQMIFGTIGVGMSAISVSVFSRSLLASQRNGYAQDIQIYLVVSGFWASSCYAGEFVGSTFGGIVALPLGFCKASMILWFFFIVMAVFNAMELQYLIKNKMSRNNITYRPIK